MFYDSGFALFRGKAFKKAANQKSLKKNTEF